MTVRSVPELGMRNSDDSLLGIRRRRDGCSSARPGAFCPRVVRIKWRLLFVPEDTTQRLHLGTDKRNEIQMARTGAQEQGSPSCPALLTIQRVKRARVKIWWGNGTGPESCH